MSDENDSKQRNDDDDGDGRLELGGRHILSASPLIWVLLAGALIWAVWATITRGSSSSGKAGARVVLVPTAGTDRMVVALPCSALGGSSSGGSSGGGSGGSSGGSSSGGS